jgi:hypothetical protein
VTTTLALYGLDEAGNLSAPLSRAFVVDTVRPVLTVTDLIPPQIYSNTPISVGGAVSDGGGVSQLIAVIVTPDGDSVIELISLDGSPWQHTLSFNGTGEFIVYLEAQDYAGNVRLAGPFVVEVIAPPAAIPMHSARFNLRGRINWNGAVDLEGLIQIRDVNGLRVSDATVFATWTFPGGGTMDATAVTDGNGHAPFVHKGVYGPGSYSLTITNVTKNGYLFNPAGSIMSRSINLNTLLSTPLGQQSVFTAGNANFENAVYTWNFGDGSASVSGADVVHTYAAAGMYEVTLTIVLPDGELTLTMPQEVVQPTSVSLTGFGGEATNVLRPLIVAGLIGLLIFLAAPRRRRRRLA